MIKIILPIVLLLFSVELFSQDAIVAASNTTKLNNIQLSWTLGETFTESYTNSITLSEGMSSSGINITSTRKIGNDIIDIKAYPNPTPNKITITLNNAENKIYTTKLFNINGEFIDTFETSNSELNIDLSTSPTGTYILEIFQDKLIVNSLKVIKK